MNPNAPTNAASPRLSLEKPKATPTAKINDKLVVLKTAAPGALIINPIQYPTEYLANKVGSVPMAPILFNNAAKGKTQIGKINTLPKRCN
jgi:hypothetical protein